MNDAKYQTYEITVARDSEEAEFFVAWLTAHGHEASLGDASEVDGVWTAVDAEANEIMRSLWDSYCAD